MDDDPDVSREPPQHRLQSVRQLERCVARDLEALLNTRREALADPPDGFVEVRRSLLGYGLPDFTSLNLLDAGDRQRVQHALEDAIAAFEPRLDRVRVGLEPPREHESAIRFRIEAVLLVEPAREPVTFDAVLQLATKEYVIQGQG